MEGEIKLAALQQAIISIERDIVRHETMFSKLEAAFIASLKSVDEKLDRLLMFMLVTTLGALSSILICILGFVLYRAKGV